MSWDGIWKSEGRLLTNKGNSGVSNLTPVLSGHVPVLPPEDLGVHIFGVDSGPELRLT